MIIWDEEQNIHEYSIWIAFHITDNIVEYEATIFGMMRSRKLGASSLLLLSDLRLVNNQYAGTFEAKDDKMKKYFERLKNECFLFNKVRIEKNFSQSNSHTDTLAMLAFLYDIEHKRIVTIMVLSNASPVKAKKLIKQIQIVP